MRLVLVLLLYPLSVRLQCAPGTAGTPCTQAQQQQLQRNFKPYWTHSIYGGRDIRRQQVSTPEQRIERSRVEMNLRLPQIHSAKAQPLQRVQQQQAFQVSGAVNHHQGRRRAHGVNNLAFNRDPIDSFERALGGDEFERRQPLEPIRVIRVTESAEMLEPMRHSGNGPNNMHQRKQRILESITRHMNEIHPPRVIPFTNRRDDVISSMLIPPRAEVKIARIEPSKTVREASSLEIADEIIDNVISETSVTTNSSDLLQSLNATDTALNQTTILNSTFTGFEMSTDQHGNDTNSPLVELSNIDKSLEAISSEIQDYGADEEWEAFSNPDGQKKKPVVVPEQAGILPTSISMPTPTTLSPEIDAIPIEAMTSSGEDEKPTTMTMQKSSPIVIEENLAESLSDVSFGSEEGQVQERTTTIATTITAAANFNEDFKTAVKEQQEEILRSRKKEQKEKKKGKEASEATEEKEKSEEGGDIEKTAPRPKHKITELNSDTIKSIEREMKKKRKKVVEKTKAGGKDKAEEVEKEEEEETEKVSKSSLGTSEEGLSLEDNSKKKLGEKKEQRKRKKTKTVERTSTAGEGDIQGISEALKQNLRQTIESISKESTEEKGIKGKGSAEGSEDSDDTGKGPKKQSHSVDEDKGEDQIEKEPNGAGGQIYDGSDELSTAMPDYSVETSGRQTSVTTIKSKKRLQITKKIPIERQWKKKQEEDENENVISDEVEEPVEVTTTEPENDSSSAEEETEREIEKKKLEKKRRKKGKRTETEDEIEEGSSTPKASTPPIRIGGYDANIRTDDIKASLKDAPNAKYYYPPKVMVPLPSCFYNPSGYVCCNLQLNNLIEDTFETVKNVQGYSACNIARMANIIQQKSEEMFGHPFESVVALSDFAQNVHFAGDLVCKVEIDGKYMLTYATPYDADHAVESVDVIEDVPIEREERVDYEQKTGGNKEKAKKSKKSKKVLKKPLPIHNFRM